MECLAVKFTAAAHNFLGIGRGLFLVLRQVLNRSLTSLKLWPGIGWLFWGIGYPLFRLLDNRS
jgi:hypothetical protein